MLFSSEERARLLATPWVGEKVIARLEQVGVADFAALAQAEVDLVCVRIAMDVGGTCWRNSPQAKRAISNAILTAKGAIAHG